MTNLASTKRPRRHTTALLFSLVVATLLGVPPLQAAPGEAAPARLKTIKIKNASTIRVVLGKKREPAAGVRSEKDGWKLVLPADLDGSSAELQDITPNARGSKWTLAVTGEKVALDPERFLPSHVYRVVFRRDGQLLGSALVYLYPPPAPPRKSRVDFADGKESDDTSAPIAPSPKGGL